MWISALLEFDTSQSCKTLSMEPGLTYSSTYNRIDIAEIAVSGKSLQSYSASISESGLFVSGFGVRMIPANSSIQLKLTFSIDNPSGSGKVHFDRHPKLN
jgi:hypothetical protein